MALCSARVEPGIGLERQDHRDLGTRVLMKFLRSAFEFTTQSTSFQTLMFGDEAAQVLRASKLLGVLRTTFFGLAADGET